MRAILNAFLIATVAGSYIGLTPSGQSQTVGCPGAAFTTQTEVDAFDPACTSMLGDLVISSGSSDPIRSLYPLRNINDVDNLLIIGNAELASLSGLGLTEVSQCALIVNNSSLRDLNGLSNVEFIGNTTADEHSYLCEDKGLTVEANPALTNLTSLLSLRSVGPYLRIDNNAGLQSILGLRNIEVGVNTVKILNNPLLGNLTGLEGITSISQLVVENNSALEDIDALRFFEFPETPDINSLRMVGNSQLEACQGLGPAFQWRPDRNVIPASRIKESRVELARNLFGCNSTIQIIESIRGPSVPAVTSVRSENGVIEISFVEGVGRDTLFPVLGHSLACWASRYFDGEEGGQFVLRDEVLTEKTITADAFQVSTTSNLSTTYSFDLPQVHLSHPDPTQVSGSVVAPNGTTFTLFDRSDAGDSNGSLGYPSDAEDYAQYTIRHFNATSDMDGEWTFRFYDHVSGNPTREGTIRYSVAAVSYVFVGNEIYIPQTIDEPFGHAIFQGSNVSMDTLENDVEYNCELIARADPLQHRVAYDYFPITTRLVGRPDAVNLTAVAAADFGALSFEVRGRSWVGEEIDQYEVVCTAENGGAVHRGQTSSQYEQVNVADLDQGERYNCRGRAHNSFGWGAWSESITLETESSGGLPIWLLYEAAR